MIYLNVSQEQLNDSEKLIDIVRQILDIKLTRNSKQHCFDYYNGIKPIVDIEEYDAKVFNFAKPITDIATKVFIGETPDITTIGDKKEKDKITKFKSKLYKNSFSTNLFQVGKKASICGSGYLAIFNKLGDSFPSFRALDPLSCDVVYDCSLSHDRLFAFNIISMNEIKNGVSNNYYNIYIYTKTKIFAYRTKDQSLPKIKEVGGISLLNAFVINGQETSVVDHGYKDIPIIEFPNNEEHVGDAECVYDLIKAYNEIQNNRLKNVDDIVQYILLVKNARLGSEEETREVVNTLKSSRVLALEGDNVDAKYLVNPLDQNQMKVLSAEIKDSIHYISRVPDLSSTDFSQNASDPILKMKTKPLIDLCGEKELSLHQVYY